MGCRRKEKWSERENKTTKQDDEAGIHQVQVGGGDFPRGRKNKKKKKKEVQVGPPLSTTHGEVSFGLQVQGGGGKDRLPA